VDRKTRIREYKETARPAGVYRIRNVVSGKSLVGSNKDVPAMLNRLRFQLEAGLHPNRELQRDWNDCGEAAFAFETLDLLEPSEDGDTDLAEDLQMLEQLWREKLALPDDLRYDGERS